MEATAQSGAHATRRVTAVSLRVWSPARGWRSCRLTDLPGAELVIAGAEATERREGHRVVVELIVDGRTHRVTSDRVWRGGQWVDLLELPPPAAWALKAAAAP